jgi:N-acetylmuramoyl-L-alanine amidase
MPALLTENGFIDTPSDASKLKDTSFLNKIARGHVNGLVKAFHLSEKSTELYKVQIGAFSKKLNADDLVSKAKEKGFDAITIVENGLYKVQIGAFASKENAGNLAAKAKKTGFDVIVIYE